MNMSRRQSMQYSASVLAGLSLGAIKSSETAAQNPPQPQPDKLVETPLRNIPPLPLNADGSAPEHKPEEAGKLTGVLWKTRQTPDIEFDYRKIKIKLDVRGTAKLSGTVSFSDLEKLPRHSQITLLQCGAPMPRGIVKWTGVRFADFAQSVGMQNFAAYGRLTGSDEYFIDEDMKTLMHPQVMLAWLINDQPLPPENGAPLRLVVPFRYGARSLKAITSIEFTATAFQPPKPWPTRG